MSEPQFSIRYNLPRSLLRVSGTVGENWDWGRNQLVSDAKTVTVDLVVAADSMARARLELDGGVWAETSTEISFTSDGRLQALDCVSTGTRSATYTTLFTGIANGIASALGAGKGADDDAEAGDPPKDEPTKGGDDKDGDDSAAAGKDAAPADDAADPRGDGKQSQKDPSAGPDTSADIKKAAADAEKATETSAATDGGKHTAQAPVPDAPTQPPADGDDARPADETPADQPAGDQTGHDDPKDGRPEGARGQRKRRQSRYERDYPDFAHQRTRAIALGIALQDQLLDAIQSGEANFADTTTAIHDRLTSLKPVLGALDEHYATWREQNEVRRSVEVQYDLDIWDLPHDRTDSPWKVAKGRASIRAALAEELEVTAARPHEQEQARETTKTVSPATEPQRLDQNAEQVGTNQRSGRRNFYMSRDRRDARDASLSAFDRFGVVISYRHLYRSGEDRDDDPDTDFDLREEEMPSTSPGQLLFRHPRQVDFRVYRIAPGPDGREVLELETLRHETVVDEASSYDVLKLTTGKDAKHQMGIETHVTGTPSKITKLDESERAAKLKAISEGTEAYAKAIAALAPYAVKAATGLPSLVLDGVNSIERLDGDGTTTRRRPRQAVRSLIDDPVMLMGAPADMWTPDERTVTRALSTTPVADPPERSD